MDPYHKRCRRCNAPARICSEYFLCSNVKCKTNKKFKTIIKHQKPIIIVGSNKEMPIPVKCPHCNNLARSFAANIDPTKHTAQCSHCFMVFHFVFESNFWYRGCYDRYTYKYTGIAGDYWVPASASI